MATSAEKRIADVNLRLQKRLAEAGDLDTSLAESQMAIVQETQAVFSDELGKMGVQVDKVEANWNKQLNVWRRAGVDLGALTAAPIVNLLMIEIVRRMAKWSQADSKDGKGFWANNGDVMAGAVPLGIGLVGWIVDLAVKQNRWRKYQSISIKHEAAGEIAKALATLGMGTLSKAVLARYTDSKQVKVDMEAAVAENAKLRELLAQATSKNAPAKP